MQLNLQRLKKDEILWLAKHRCRHHHRYIEHTQCFLEEHPEKCPFYERIGFLDIESAGLNANWDIVISYAIKTGNKILGRVLTPKEATDWNILDKNLMEEFLKDVRQFDRLVVYWGKDRRHDLPFLRTRALKWGLDFPLYKEIYITDCYDIAKSKLRLHRNRMENVANFLKIPAKGHRLDPEKWQQAKLGNKSALNFVWKHNKEDVETLAKVYDRLVNFVRNSKVSI